MVHESMSKMKTSLVLPFLPNDLIFKILLLLPIKTLMRIQSVCKSWNKMINCAEFVKTYNNAAQTTAIFRGICEDDKLDTFHVESQVNQLENFLLFPLSFLEDQHIGVLKCLEIEDGTSKTIDLNISCFGSIVATCRGLILIKSMFVNVSFGKKTPRMRRYPEFGNHERAGRLIIMNPMTKKFFGFPVGTLPSDCTKNESYGLVFSQSEGVYKVVHLFKDELNHISCEVWSMGTRCWKPTDGPPEKLSKHFFHPAISTDGALHWLNGSYQYYTDYIISIGAEDEKFFVTDLPKSVRGYNKLVEMGGFLTLVNVMDMDRVEVWVLKGLEGTGWIKEHNIQVEAIVGHVEIKGYCKPLFAVNAKEMIFLRRRRLYSYDFELKQGTEIEMNGVDVSGYHTFMPHSNNLATWEPLEPL